jgi:predicted kinase
MIAYICVGLPASGKSSWAREKIANSLRRIGHINNDNIRNNYYSIAGHRNWSPTVENYVRESREIAIRDNARMQQDIIIDNTHMNPRTYQQTVDLCKSLGYQVEIVDFRHVSVEECVLRDSQRTGHEQVGEAVIRRMYKQYGLLRNKTPLPRPQLNPHLPTAIIVDIDGTLAEMTDRGPYDEHLVFQDQPRQHVVVTVDALRLAIRAKILVMSGRSENCRAETDRWLQEVCMMPAGSYELWMRPADDRRRDSLVKLELYEKYVKDQYAVLAVFDDRHQVVEECWDKLDLPVFRCGRINCDNF